MDCGGKSPRDGKCKAPRRIERKSSEKWYRWQDHVTIAAGLFTAALLVLTHWVGSYTSAAGAAWSSWIAGVVALVVTAAAIRPSTQSQHNVRISHERRKPVMTELTRYEVGSWTVLAEADDISHGVDHPGRNGQGIPDVGRRLEDALASVRPAARAALEAMAELTPEKVEIELGVKLAGDAGAVIARSSADAHFILRMSWSPAGAALVHDKETI